MYISRSNLSSVALESKQRKSKIQVTLKYAEMCVHNSYNSKLTAISLFNYDDAFGPNT